MKKVFLLTLFFILFININLTYARNVSELELDINWAHYSSIDVEWRPDSAEVAVIYDKGLSIVDKNGKSRYRIEKKHDYGLYVEWINNNKIAITYGYPDFLEIIDLETGESKKIDLTHFVSSLCYNKHRNELAIAYDNVVSLLELETNRFYSLIEIAGVGINDVFYNEDGSRLFFTAQSGNFPHLYTYDFEDWVFDRVSEEYLTPRYVKKEENIGYFDEDVWGEYGIETERVVMDLETLIIKEYEEKESNIVIDGYKINPDFNPKLYSSEDKESIYVVLSPDEESALVMNKDEVKIIKDLSTYQEQNR